MESNTPPNSTDSTPDSVPLTAPAPGTVPSEPAGQTKANDSGVDAGESADEPNSFENRMPDPSSLVAMAAMHLSTEALLPVLLAVFDHHAWRSIGLVADHTGEAKKDLPSAQLAIDCYAFMLGKVEGKLDESEKRDAQRRLMDLRMNYVAKTREG
jgi:hypothetical protein